MRSISLQDSRLSKEDFLLENIMPEPNSGCWLWTGSLNDDLGYA